MNTSARTWVRQFVKRAFRAIGLEVERHVPPAPAVQPEPADLSNLATRLSLSLAVDRARSRRPAPFVLVATDHGSLIVNRNDYNTLSRNYHYGMGFQLFNASSYDYEEVTLALSLLSTRKETHGSGLIAVDCGANIGVHTVEWARHMYGWGEVIAIEAQERLYYSLCGNITINNCLNAKAHFAAVGAVSGKMQVPLPNYYKPASFGSLELRQSESTEFIGQDVDYNIEACTTIDVISIDEMELDRLDFIKIDVEGMEVDVLAGAETTIARHKPIMIIEIIKSDLAKITAFLVRHGYKHHPFAGNILAVHESDPLSARILELEGLSKDK